MQAETLASIQMPHRLAQVESRVTPSILFLVGVAWVVHRNWRRDLAPYANRMGKHAYQAHFDGKIY